MRLGVEVESLIKAGVLVDAIPLKQIYMGASDNDNCCFLRGRRPSMKHRAVNIPLYLTVFAVFAQSVFSIYEDQVGLIDWSFQNIGEVSNAIIGAKRRLFVGTKDGILASLDLRTGEIIWRQVLAENERISALLQPKPQV